MKCSDDKDLFYLFQEYAHLEQFRKENDDLLFAKILIDWVQTDSITIMHVGQCWIDDFLICNLQFPDFSYSTENHELKDR